MKKKHMGRNLAKSMLLGGMLLTLGGCYASGFRNTDCYPKDIINLQSQETTTSSSKKDKQKVLIELSSHFDDAILSNGGIISEFDGTKYIVTFFSSAPTFIEGLTKWDEISGFDKSADSEDIRAKENVNVANFSGAIVINKSYVDNQYEKPRSSSHISSLIEAITKDIEQIIESNNDVQLTVIGPSYFGDKITHPDHLIVFKAFMQAIKNKCYANADFYLYEDLPYTYKRFGTSEITIDKMITSLYEGLTLSKKEIIISPEAFNLKLKAIRLYSSQVEAFESLGEDIINEITDFGMRRCVQLPLSPKPCEVIYEIN